jgi:hypothetical protein
MVSLVVRPLVLMARPKYSGRFTADDSVTVQVFPLLSVIDVIVPPAADTLMIATIVSFRAGAVVTGTGAVVAADPVAKCPMM